MRLTLSIFILAAALSSAACNRGNNDRLSDDQVADADSAEPKAVAPDRRCTAAASHEIVKRELFNRAAEIRGSNATSYARIAEFALLQVDNAAPEAATSPGEAVECRGRATLRLPPNLAVAGGRTSLSGTIGFSVGRAVPGTAPVVTLTDDEAITIPLSTLSQKRAAPPPKEVADEPAADPIAPLPPEAAAPPPAPEPVVIRPSFDCRAARTRGEIAVCASPSLAGLDQAMATQYRAALGRADPPRARLLQETRDRFLGYRDRCPDDACIATTYRGRMREIDDIMAGRWRGR